jgi:hypothetical protein
MDDELAKRIYQLEWELIYRKARGRKLTHWYRQPSSNSLGIEMRQWRRLTKQEQEATQAKFGKRK